jgi:hypothetical protein
VSGLSRAVQWLRPKVRPPLLIVPYNWDLTRGGYRQLYRARWAVVAEQQRVARLANEAAEEARQEEKVAETLTAKLRAAEEEAAAREAVVAATLAAEVAERAREEETLAELATQRKTDEEKVQEMDFLQAVIPNSEQATEEHVTSPSSQRPGWTSQNKYGNRDTAAAVADTVMELYTL